MILKTQKEIQKLVTVFGYCLGRSHWYIVSIWARILRIFFWIVRMATRREIVAICRFQHLGDIIAAEPVARSVRNKHTDAVIVWFCDSPYTQLLKKNPFIDYVIPVYCYSAVVLLERWGCLRTLYDLHFEIKSCPVCDLLRNSKTTHGVSTQNYYLDARTLLTAFCTTAGLNMPKDDQPCLYCFPRDRRKKEDAIVIHVKTASSSLRDWDSKRWIELVELLVLRGYEVYEVGLKSDIVDSLSSASYHNMCGKLSLIKTAELIQQARCFVGIDSGPAHIANAVKTSGVLLFGNYKGFGEYCPYTGFYGDGKGGTILRGEKVTDISVSSVYDAIEVVMNETI